MDISSKFTVIFDGKFYIGLFEKEENQIHQTSKILFSTNPSETELYEYILKNYHRVNFRNCFASDNLDFKRKTFPKKIQRKLNLIEKTLRII